MKKNKRIILVFAITCFIVSLSAQTEMLTSQVGSNVVPQPSTKHTKLLTATPHDPIYISSDQNFSDTATANGWDGDGSPEQPYIIENLEIEAYRMGFTHCIRISGTTVHFIIRNCILKYANATINSAGVLSYSPHGQFLNNIVYNCSNGIWIYSDNNVVDGNTCYDNELAIRIENSEFCTISSNNCSYNMDDGIKLIFSHNNTIRDNTCNYNPGNAIYLADVSMDNQIVNNNCSINHVGIFVSMSLENTISNNYLFGNDNQAAFFSSASDNLFTNNTCGEERISSVWLSADSSTNTVSWNSFYIHPAQAVDNDGSANIIDYNFYSEYLTLFPNGNDTNDDGIWDYPVLDDDHPLVYPPTVPKWNEIPSLQLVEYGTHFSLNLNASSASPIISWSINYTSHFDIDSNGVIVNNTILEVGSYILEVVVSNLYGFTARMIVSITIQDTTPPEWLSAQTEHTFEQSEEIEITIVAWDRSGVVSWSISENPYFWFSANVSEQISSCRIGSDVVPPADIYELYLTAFDPYDNSRTADLTITITESPHTTSLTTSTYSTSVTSTITSTSSTPTSFPTSATSSTTTIMTTTSTTEPEPVGTDTMVYIIAGIGGLVIVIVVIIIIRRKGS